MLRNFGTFQKVTVSNFLVKLMWNFPTASGWNKKTKVKGSLQEMRTNQRGNLG